MGIPVIKTELDFRKYVEGVHMRRGFKLPKAFAIGAVRYDEGGHLVDAVFPKVNASENFGSAAAFADVTHHRSGNAVRTLDFWECRELEGLFQPYLHDLESHPNIAAFVEVQRLMCPPHYMKPVVVFIGELDTSFIDRDLDPDGVQGGERLRPIYDKFLELIGDRVS